MTLTRLTSYSTGFTRRVISGVIRVTSLLDEFHSSSRTYKGFNMLNKQSYPALFTIALFILTSIAFLGLVRPILASNKAPGGVAGFELGSSIDNYPDLMDTNYLRETVVTDWRGFRKGVLSYGTCKYHKQILKIQMKYEDSSEDFYEVLLKKYKAKFGPPSEWKGDSFGILRIWKWYFTDEQDRAVSLILQHNLRNPNETMGNMVKISFPHLLEEERLCFNKMCEEMKTEQDKARLEEIRKADWKYMIPD